MKKGSRFSGRNWSSTVQRARGLNEVCKIVCDVMFPQLVLATKVYSRQCLERTHRKTWLQKIKQSLCKQGCAHKCGLVILLSSNRMASVDLRRGIAYNRQEFPKYHQALEGAMLLFSQIKVSASESWSIDAVLYKGGPWKFDPYFKSVFICFNLYTAVLMTINYKKKLRKCLKTLIRYIIETRDCTHLIIRIFHNLLKPWIQRQAAKYV